jgi:hypothetical protein
MGLDRLACGTKEEAVAAAQDVTDQITALRERVRDVLERL